MVWDFQLDTTSIIRFITVMITTTTTDCMILTTTVITTGDMIHIITIRTIGTTTLSGTITGTLLL